MTRIVKGAIVVEQAWLVRHLRSRGTIGMILLWALYKVAPFRWLAAQGPSRACRLRPCRLDPLTKGGLNL